MTDRHPVDDRVRAYMVWRARRDVPAGLEEKALEAVRGHPAPRRRFPELIAVGAVAVVVFAALAVGIAGRGHGSQSSGAGGTTTVPVDPCRNSPACLTIDAVISGAETLSGEQRRPVSSCTDVLAVDTEGAVPPRLSGTLGGRPVSSFLKLPSPDPGTYPYEASPTYPVDVLDIGDVHYVDSASGVSQIAMGTVAIGPDGSGSYSLQGVFDETRPTRTVSLRVSWQCTPR